ncbi:MAG TPA: hypothetical protein VG755_17345 [Nannocystaceae bacterium]|nr:hypothetical protein [Nannocystaceae bacterium]
MRIAIALVVVLGCDGGGAEKPAPAQAVATETKVDDAKKVDDVKTTHDGKVDESPPEAPASAKPPVTVGTAPQWSDVLALARAQGLTKPAKAAAMVGLGGDRWAAAMRTTDREAGDDGGAWSMHVLVVDARKPPLQLVDRRALVSWGDTGTSDEPSRAPVALFADDYDGDGSRELLVRFGFDLMLCGIGEVERRELRIYGTAADGKLRPQVALTLDDRIYYGADIGRESFADRNADGHPDLVVTERSTHEDVDNENEGRPIHKRREDVYAYDPKADVYTKADAKPVKDRAAFDLRMYDTCEEGESPGSSPL